jgi:nucleoside-diphosphate kinase
MSFIMIQHTLSLIKPDAISKGIVGKILSYLEDGGLRIVASKLTLLSRDMAEEFYFIHKDKPFFVELSDYITSGPVIAQVLKGENAIEVNRAIMGATDPQKAEKNTIRGDLATSINANLVHGSDSPESAQREIALFFSGYEIFN